MKILFFSLHSAIWAHAFPEALVAEALRDAGHQIDYVTCGAQLQAGCTAMRAVGVTEQSSKERRLEVCRRCGAQANLIRIEFGFNGRELASYIEATDEIEIDAILGLVTRENFLDLTVHGVDVGRIATYEFSIVAKKSSIGFENEGEWKQYRVLLKNALFALFGGVRILKEVKPDALIVYNSLYSVNNVLCRLADLRGIRRYMLHAGGNLGHWLKSMMFVRGDIFDFLFSAKKYWADHPNLPIRSDMAAQVTDHFLELLRGRSPFAYSTPKADASRDIRKYFGIQPGQRILCATLSSYDERFAAETVGVLKPVDNLIFADQEDWVRGLVAYLDGRDDLFLIIRVHPREFPNKREGVKSAHARQLESALRNLPGNVRVNWPTDQVSLYDLAEETSVFLNAWSSVGKEMALLGLPVVVYSDEYIHYPSDLNYLAEDREGYFAAIEQALFDGWRYENVRKAYRWHQIEFGRILLDISDSYAGARPVPAGLMGRGLRKLLRMLDPLNEQRADCKRRSRPLAEGGRFAQVVETGSTSVLDLVQIEDDRLVNEEEERAILRQEMGRLAIALFGGQGTGESSLLRRHIDAFIHGKSAPGGILTEREV